MKYEGVRWWQIGCTVGVCVSLLAFFVQSIVLYSIHAKKRHKPDAEKGEESDGEKRLSDAEKRQNFPIFGVYFCMHQYSPRIGCAIIAACQIVFMVYAITMNLHVFDRPLYGVVPPIFGLFAAVVGMSLELHCCIRWLFGWLLIGLIMIDITGAALVESDIHCLEDNLCDIDSLPPINWLWVNFIVRIISFTTNIYSILVSSFITWEMGCCLQNDADYICYRCDRYPLTAWEPMYDSRSNKEAVFDMERARELREGARNRRLSQIQSLDSIKRSNSFSRTAATTRVIQSRPSNNFETKTTAL